MTYPDTAPPRPAADPVLEWRKAVLPAAVILCACGSGQDAVTTTRADSAGVTIVSNLGADRTRSSSLRLEYRLGGQPSGPESFYELYPFQVSIGSTGVIGVLNRQAFQAATFSPDGKPLASYGQKGGGPGEFRFPSSIAVRPNGDVLVYDYGKRALVPFAADGTALDEIHLTVPFNGVGMVATRDGLVVLSEARPRGKGTMTRRVLHLSPGDTTQLGPSTTAAFKGVEYKSCGVSMSQPPLFAAELVWASNGVRTAVAAGPGYSIWVFDDTTLVDVIRRDIRPEVVTKAVAEREVGEGERWEIGGRECLVPADEVLDQRGYAPAVPVVEAVAVTPTGGLWVRRRRPGMQERAVDVFDQDGRYVETLSPPPPFPIGFLPDGRAVTIEKDSLDVQTLAVYDADVDGGDPR